MKDKDLNELFVERFPEIKGELEKEISWQEGMDTSADNTFEFVFVPYIINKYTDNQTSALVKIFDFIEELCNMNDERNNEIVCCSVLEPLILNHPDMDVDKYFGIDKKDCRFN